MHLSLCSNKGGECLTMVFYILFDCPFWGSNLFAMEIPQEFQRIYPDTYSPILNCASTL